MSMHAQGKKGRAGAATGSVEPVAADPSHELGARAGPFPAAGLTACADRLKRTGCIPAPCPTGPLDVNTTTLPPALTALQLERALQLLGQSGQPLPAGAPGSPAWLQGLIDALVELSSRDALTGLANRRAFDLALTREIDRVARSGEPALLLVLDIDHFKRVNDSWGHVWRRGHQGRGQRADRQRAPHGPGGPRGRRGIRHHLAQLRQRLRRDGGRAHPAPC